MESTMSAHAYTASKAAAQLSFFNWALRRKPRIQRLDLDSLSDHLKRDLGFAGGRDPAPRNVLRD
jgi:uncharacterized protein YjiS (DUF1127 family)